MDKPYRQEKNFIEGVWKKVRYLEYKKAEEELVKKNQRISILRKLKLGASLVAVVLVAAILTFILFGINPGTIVLVGSTALGAGAFYEYSQDLKLDWRSFYGYRNKKTV
ncbi:MAG: hypothetical protein ACOYWZ_20570 [Bacillota bacterium]